MRKIKRTAILVLSVLCFFQAAAQKKASLKEVSKRLDASQKNFSKLLVNSQLDKNARAVLSRLATTETDSLQKFIIKDKNLPLSQKLQALNCQCYFLDTLQAQVSSKILDVSQVRDDRDYFYPLWQTILSQRPYDEIMKPFGPQTAGLMAGVFKEYPQAERIKDISTLKNLETTPEMIMQFLDKNTGFSLRDTLLYICANTQPERLINYLMESKNKELIEVMWKQSSPLVQTLLQVSLQKNYTNYLPFVSLLAEKKTTLSKIDEARTQPSKYYQMMVDAELENMQKRATGTTPQYMVPLRNYLKKYAIMFYTDVINSLHEEPREKDRFYVLDGLRPQDLYFIITTGETELYTSSYLYTYKKLMGMFDKNNADSLLRLVKYSQYRKFLLMSGRYSTISDFMKQMPKDSSISIIKRLMKGLEERSANGMESTINIAETFPGIVNDNDLFAISTSEIKSNITRCQKIPNPYGTNVYNILLEVIHVVKDENTNNLNNIPPALSAYFKISHRDLREKNGNITQLVLFYGDDDGKSSYSSFMTNFSDASQWSVEKNDYWVTIKSKKLYPVSIYANLPLDETNDKDLKAQDLLRSFLTKEKIFPNILIHRGHSYHLQNSIRCVTPDTHLAILGSCGGYREIFEVLAKSGEAQVISTKQVGSLQVNEPMLRAINDQLLHEKDLDWSVIWSNLDKQFKPRQQAYEYFQEYVPPYKNIALLVAALFKKYDPLGQVL